MARRSLRPELWVPAVYAAIATTWIALSDLVVSTNARTAAEQTAWSIGKGIGFVVVTAIGLHRVIRWALFRERDAIDALRQENDRKTRFIAMLSHELRNPLAPVRHALWILDRAAPASVQAVHAKETIARQVLHLSRITDDLLDVTRLSERRFDVQKKRIDLVALLQQVSKDHEGVFAARGVSLECSLGHLPLWAEADPTRVAQVAGCLLWNAAKFTEPGGRARISLERGASGTAEIRVSDTGIGIPASMLGHVFEPFFQADSTLDRKRGGLGLGLSIAKALVELHHGSIAAHSDGAGQGAEFVVRLPLAPESPILKNSARRARAATPRHRILVVEDNVDAAETLQEMLLMWEHEVEVARDGREALEKARAFHPDVVLCDIGLPVMDGYEVARALKADPDLSSTFLVAVTGYASADDARKAAAAGFDRHLGKPVPIEVIQEVLATVPVSGEALLH